VEEGGWRCVFLFCGLGMRGRCYGLSGLLLRWLVISYMLVFATRGGEVYSLFWDHVNATHLLKNTSDILGQASKDLFGVRLSLFRILDSC
jgi:hypothetical protein